MAGGTDDLEKWTYIGDNPLQMDIVTYAMYKLLPDSRHHDIHDNSFTAFLILEENGSLCFFIAL